jgi:hypothetical protein
VKWGHGRRKPYTEIGIRRMPCARCGKPSRFQWQICADGRLFRPLCAECDVELNEMVMRWVWGDLREADIARYRQKVNTS